jgi:hypothetical protein
MALTHLKIFHIEFYAFISQHSAYITYVSPFSARVFGQHQGTVPPRPNLPLENSVASTGLEQLRPAEMERRMKLLRDNRLCDYLKHPHNVLFRHMDQAAFLFFPGKKHCV